MNDQDGPFLPKPRLDACKISQLQILARERAPLPRAAVRGGAPGNVTANQAACASNPGSGAIVEIVKCVN